MGSKAYFILGFRVPTTWNRKSSITTYSGQMSPPPTRERRERRGSKGGVKGVKGSEGGKEGAKGSKGERSMFYTRF